MSSMPRQSKKQQLVLTTRTWTIIPSIFCWLHAKYEPLFIVNQPKVVDNFYEKCKIDKTTKNRVCLEYYFQIIVT